MFLESSQSPEVPDQPGRAEGDYENWADNHCDYRDYLYELRNVSSGEHQAAVDASRIETLIQIQYMLTHVEERYEPHCKSYLPHSPVSMDTRAERGSDACYLGDVERADGKNVHYGKVTLEVALKRTEEVPCYPVSS